MSIITHHRTILPIRATCSLKVDPAKGSQQPTFDPERAAVKLQMRITDYFLNSLREIVLDTQFFKGKTTHQGARASHGYQAAHHSLIPNPQDSVCSNMIKRVALSTFTPTKSLPYCKARTGLTSPELKQLKAAATDENAFRTQLLDKMPTGAEGSSIAGTSAYLFGNATADNPNECNQLDSKLERTIAPFLAKLQRKRAQRKLDAIESTQHLISWMSRFYQNSLKNCAERKQDLTTCLEILNQSEELTLSARKQVFEILNKRFKALPSSRASTKLSGRQLREFISKKLTSLDHFYKEATTQLEQLKLYDSPCTVRDLQLGLFGIMENGKRREPTPDELRSAVFATLRPDPHYPAARKKLEFKLEPPRPSF